MKIQFERATRELVFEETTAAKAWTRRLSFVGKGKHALTPKPSGKQFSPALLAEYLLSLRLRRPTFLVGFQGSGKTSLAIEISALRQKPTLVVDCHADMLLSAFLGRNGLGTDDEGNTVTVAEDGPVTAAVRNGYTLVLNELNCVRPEVLSAFHCLLEDNPNQRKLVLPDRNVVYGDGTSGPEVVEVHPDFEFVATGNAVGPLADKLASFAGNRAMNVAFLSRFDVIVVETELTPRMLVEFVCKHPQIRFRESEKAKLMAWAMVLAHEVQDLWAKAFDAKQLPTPFSVRQAKAFLECLWLLREPLPALRMSVLDQLEEKAGAIAFRVFESAVGTDLLEAF